MKKLTTISFICLISFSCTKNVLTPTCDGSAPTYNAEIGPLLMANCSSTSSCHGSGANNHRGEMTTYAQFKPYLDDGDFRKRVLEKQNMPKGTVLTQTDINLIQCWADNGYPEN